MDENGEYEFLEQRVCASDYAIFIDKFASAVVGNKNWGRNKDNPMTEVIEGNKCFNDLMTVSDEAFINVCFRNYRERWFEEAHLRCKHVS